MAHETSRITPQGLLVETSVSPDGILTTRTTAPQSRAILEQNKLLRNEGLVKNKDELHFELSIPEFDYHMLCRKYPDLACGDPDTEDMAWRKFLRSSEAKPYKVIG
jgi:hypothetical protein